MALGCRKCGGNGGKLDSESFLAHLAALVGETARHVAAHATNDRVAIETPSPLPARAWGGTGRTEGLRFREGGRGAFVRYLPAMAFYRFRVAFWPVKSFPWGCAGRPLLEKELPCGRFTEKISQSGVGIPTHPLNLSSGRPFFKCVRTRG